MLVELTALRPAAPPARHPSSHPCRSSSIACRPPALILPLCHPQLLVLPSSPILTRSSSRNRLPTCMARVPSRLTWTCHVPVSIMPPSLRPSLTTMLLNVQHSCTVPPPPALTTHTTPATRCLPRQLTSASLRSSASTLHIHPLVSPTVSPSRHLHCRSCSPTTTTIMQDAFTA